jgi:hypothetical protein
VGSATVLLAVEKWVEGILLDGLSFWLVLVVELGSDVGLNLSPNILLKAALLFGDKLLLAIFAFVLSVNWFLLWCETLVALLVLPFGDTEGPVGWVELETFAGDFMVALTFMFELNCLFTEGFGATDETELVVVVEGEEETAAGRALAEELVFGSFGIVNLDVEVFLNRPVPPGPILLLLSIPDNLVLVILILRGPPEFCFIVNWSELLEYLVLGSLNLLLPLWVTFGADVVSGLLVESELLSGLPLSFGPQFCPGIKPVASALKLFFKRSTTAVRELLREIFATFADCCLDEETDDAAKDDVGPDESDGDSEEEDETAIEDEPDFDEVRDEVEDMPDFCLIPPINWDLLLWSFVLPGDEFNPLLELDVLDLDDLKDKLFGEWDGVILPLLSESDILGETL